MAEEKLLGTQYLKLDRLRSDVGKANELLKSLGTGVELDFSNKITSQLKSQLNEIVKATQDAANTTKSLSSQMSSAAAGIASGAGKQAQTDAQNINKLTSLYKQQYSVRAKLQATDPKSNKGMVLSAQASDIEKQIKSIESLNAKYSQHKKVLDAVADGKKKLEVAKATAQDKKEAEALKKTSEAAKQAEEAYRNLKNAYSNYDKAVKRGDSESASYWASEIENNKSILASLESQADALGLNESQRKKLNNLIRQSKDQESAHGRELDNTAKKTEQITNQMLRWVGTMVILRGLTTLWRNATEYAGTYYDKLNEIRIVTGMSESESLKLGENYRQMAKDMKVSSTDIVSAATEFWRQGLPEDQVDARQVATTQYAKISGLAFEEAAELVTAATNSMNLDVQRVVDVFNYLGDASASGADEIGIAMQKASASANEAGVSFEWLGAYIATISEQTRQAPEVIGTSMNSIMARLHSIKQKGFNEEDETKINDVAKALDKVGIALMDQDGNWRDLSTIFIELSSVWGTLDDKTRAYIATTMAGTRQQNYFLALMNDMAKGVEGGSRAFELYEGAINSAGTTTQKYAIWMESVQAAQNGLTAEMEEFYSLLSADWMKGFYNSMAGIVAGINAGTDSMKGMNLVIPLVVAGIAGLAAAMTSAAGAAGVTSQTLGGLWTIMQAHPIALAVTAFAVLAGLMTGISSATQDASIDMGKAMDDMNKDITEQNTVQKTFTDNGREIENLKQRYIELAGKATLTATEQAELQSVMERIASISPALADAIRTTSGAFGAQAEVLRGLNAELEENYQYGQLSGQKAARDGFQSAASVIAGYNKQQEENKTQQLALSNYYSYRDKNFSKTGEGLFSKDGIQVTTQEMVEQYVLSVLSDAAAKAPHGATSDYVNMAGKTLAANWGIDEDTWTALWYGFSATDKKAKRNSELISAITDAVDNAEYYGMQDQEKYNSAVSSASAFLDAFKDTKGLSSPILEDANAKAEAVFSEINWATTSSDELWKSQTLASQQYQSIFADAQKKQEELNASPEASILQRDLDKAKAVFEADRTEENLNAYNALVRKWNENFGEYAKIEELSQDSIKNAEDATGTTEESIGAAAEYADIVSKRMEAQTAAEQGYVNQLNEAKAAYNKDGFQGYRDYMDNLAESNKNLYEGMMDAYSEYDLANIYKGNLAGDEAIKALDQAILKSDEVAKANTAYYNGVQGTAESTTAALSEAPDLQEYISGALASLQSGFAQGKDQQGLDSLIAYITSLGEEAQASLMAVAPWLPKVMDGTMSYGDVLKELNTLMTGTAENWTAFFEQLTGDTSAGTEEALAFIDRLTGMEGDTESIENFRTAWNALTDDAREAVYDLLGTDMKEYLDEVVEGGEDSQEAFEKLRKEARKLRRENTAKYFKDTVKATYDLEDGTKTVEEAYADFRKEAEKATEANEEYAAASEKVAEGTEVAAEDIQTLSDYLGMAPETIIKNWDVAGRMLASSLAEGEAALHALNEAAFINITGTSSADFSALSNGLMLVTAQAQNVVDALRATGQWELETIELPQEAKYWIPNADGTGGSWGTVTATAGAKVLRYTGSKLGAATGGNASGGKTSGGGGGGGGGGSKVDNTADEKNLVDNMNWEIEAVDRRMAQLNAIMSKYETEGYLTGVINCLEMENELLEEQNTLYQDNIDTLDGKLGALRAELSKLTPGTAEYDDVLAQIEILQDAYGEYTQAILENEAAIAENIEAMKEQREAIRDMEIDLREELLQAIEDRQEREEEALSARIEMEEKILDIIIRRHEKERDQILETTEMQIEALEREKDALDEALEARRQAAEEEDRNLELRELEAQYARIIADPTRAKEALEIQKEIAELRDEIAWDKAEQEVEAQQESLDQQITSLDDYREYIEKYYEDLLENPRNFLEEVNEILSMSHEDVLEWLRQYSEDYTNATDSARTEMENGWSDTLDTMNGIIRTHWEEIEKIISEGDDAIVEFLKENSQDYKEAGELQAQAYVDAWVEQLEDLHKAYLDLKPELPDVKETNTTATSTSSGKSGGGGGGGGSKTKTGWQFTNYYKSEVKGFKTKEEATSAASSHFNSLPMTIISSSHAGQYYNDIMSSVKSYKYKTGGLASFTGPAWLDGSPSAPERVLSPYQTKLFENLVMSLQKVATVNIPSLPFISSPERGASGSYSFGDIVVNVDKLESDADYEEMARKVGEVILRQMNKGSYVGGIRYSF